MVLEAEMSSVVVLRFYLKENYPEETRFSPQFETSSIVSLKEAIKWSLIAPLESKLVSHRVCNVMSSDCFCGLL